MKHKPMGLYGMLLVYATRDLRADPSAWQNWFCVVAVVAIAAHEAFVKE